MMLEDTEIEALPKDGAGCFNTLSRRSFLTQTAFGLTLFVWGMASGKERETTMKGWTCVYKLNADRKVVSGSAEELAKAIRQGADLRCFTTFRYDDQYGFVEEMIDFRQTWLLDNRYTAGITTTRYPVDGALGFNPRPSLSFFLYNQEGQFGIARPFLDGGKGEATTGTLENYKILDEHDSSSSCPSHNAIYRFGEYQWWVRDDWEEVYAHDANGSPRHGKRDDVIRAFRAGKVLKVGIRNVCADLARDKDKPLAHEVFIEMGSTFNHVEHGFLGAESLPIMRLAPAIPLAYASGNFEFGWVLPRTDGKVHLNMCNPFTLRFRQFWSNHALRWFAR